MAASIDDDVLQLLFEEFGRGGPWKWPDAVYDVDVARRPFLLASVSRRWRSLALATSSLWTYFGFPEDAKLYPKHSERLQMLIAASKNASVDIILSLGTAQEFNTHNSADQGTEIIETLSRLGPRWRHVRFRLPSDATSLLRPTLDGPLPNLLSLSATTIHSWNFLLSAPHLGRLYVEAERDLGETSTTPLWHYPALSSLTVSGKSLAEALCMNNFSTLTHLCILTDMDNPPTQPIHLPRLASLTIEDAHFLPHIDAPSLVRLGVDGSSVFDALQVLSSFKGVETLVLYGYLEEDLTLGLWDLSGVQLLIFHMPVPVLTYYAPVSEYSTSSRFFRSLNGDIRGLTWPLLRRIQFRRPHADNQVRCYDDDDPLMFVQKRNTEYAASQRAARIEEIIIEPSDLITPVTATQLAQLTTLRGEPSSHQPFVGE